MSYRIGGANQSPLEPLGGIEGLWKPPPGFKFPTDAQYLTNLAKGMADIRPILESKVDSFIAPIKSQASSVIATIEGTSKVAIPIGGDAMKIAAAAMAIGDSKDAVTVAANVGALLNGTLSLVTDVAKVVGPLSGALSVVPMVGQAAGLIISAMVPFIKFATSAELAQQQAKAAYEQCLSDLQSKASEPCLSKYKSQTNVFGTGPKGTVTPSDLFRPFLYWSKTDWPKTKNRTYGDRKLPACVGYLESSSGGKCTNWFNEDMDAAWVPTLGAMFVALCGDQIDPGFFVSSVKPSFLFKNYGTMTADTRRRMWGLIKGIMAATEDPDKGPGPNQGGMALFPSLQGLIWREFEENRLKVEHIADAAKDISDPFFLSGYQCPYDVPKAGSSSEKTQMQDVTLLCGPYVVGSLVDAFMQMKLSFMSSYFTGDLGWDPKYKVFNLKSVPLMEYKKPSSSLKLLSSAPALNTILKGVGVYDKASALVAEKKQQEEALKQQQESQKAAVAKLTTGALVLGGAGVAAYLLSQRNKLS